MEDNNLDLLSANDVYNLETLAGIKAEKYLIVFQVMRDELGYTLSSAGSDRYGILHDLTMNVLSDFDDFKKTLYKQEEK